MRGEPLHLCSTDHVTIFYTGEACPFCAVKWSLAKAKQRIAVLEEQIRNLEAALPHPLITKETTICA